MTVKEIYEHFKIIPNLQEHQLRAAGIAWMLGAQLGSRLPLELRYYILGMALHDLGNMVRIRFDQLTDLRLQQDLPVYKENVRLAQDRYGLDDHEATRKMLLEIAAPAEISALIDKIAWRKLDEINKSADLEAMLMLYSDLRVAPRGITSMEHRITEVSARHGLSAELSRFLQQNSRLLETKLFTGIQLKPEQISETAVAAYFPRILALELK